jgi:hypothetical protein
MAMEACEQTSGLNMLQHGKMVHEFYLDLKGHITRGESLKNPWKLPAWAGCGLLWANILTDDIISEYMIFHDCGKPFCKTNDHDGKTHFPDHASMSEVMWIESGGSPEAARLMGMDIHLIKSDDMEEFAGRKAAATLLMAGLSEIHANAHMFGGIDSTSFKIKWKHLDRRGKQLSKILSQQQGIR